MILNKSGDLIEKKSYVAFRKFRSEAKEIKDLKLKWSEKMVCLQEKGFTEKDLLNLKLDDLKLKDLEFLQNQIPPGPFTKVDDVNQYMEDTPETKEKNNRMFIEIRFQKNTSAAMRKDAEVFGLNKIYHNLNTIDYAANLCQ